MDNFMDKLAKRFNAGEIIKANAAAEAKELVRAQERAKEYEKMMQEMRKLNLRNVELTEQVQQLIKSGIEGFEEYDKTGTVKTEELAGELRDKLEVSAKQIEEQIASGNQLLSQSLKQIEEKCAGQDIDQNAEMEIKLAGLKKDLEEYIHRENVKVYRNVQAALTEHMTAKARELGDRIDTVEKSVARIDGMNVLLIITFLLAVASVGIEVAKILNLF